jgi:hypothetical protein
MWQTVINLIIAIWLIATGFRNPDSPGILIFSGIVAAMFGFYIAAVRHSWQAFTIGMIGLWLFYSPIAFQLMTKPNFLISGIATAFFAIWVLALRGPREEEKPAWF